MSAAQAPASSHPAPPLSAAACTQSSRHRLLAHGPQGRISDPGLTFGAPAYSVASCRLSLQFPGAHKTQGSEIHKLLPQNGRSLCAHRMAFLSLLLLGSILWLHTCELGLFDHYLADKPSEDGDSISLLGEL